MLHRLMLAASAALLVVAMSPATLNDSSVPAPPGLQANYYGTTIDLTNGWGSAKACVTDGTTAECFDTEPEADAYVGRSAAGEQAGSAPLASCATGTKLYAGTSWNPPVLTVTTRLSWVNLGPAGFDNRTRSYRIGSCAAAMAANSGGGGGFYPGNTAAYAQSATMVSGWDRVVSSIYLH